MSVDQKSKSNLLMETLSNYLASAKDRYYELDPIQQLEKRSIFEQNFKELALNNPLDTTSSEDLFAIYDAVSRRGGFRRVQDEKRWDDVVHSLSLYNFSPQSLEHTYKTCLFKYEEKYFSEAEDYVVKGSKIDRYFIPHVGSKGLFEGYFKNKLTPSEIEIMKKLKIEHPDVYMCFRNIILAKKEPNLGALLDAISTTYHETFIKFFKFLFIYGVIDARKLKINSPTSFDLLINQDLSQRKVTIIGANLRGIHCAQLLKDYGFRVEIIDHQILKGFGKLPRFDEEVYEFMPFNVNNDVNNPTVRFLNEMKIAYGSLKISDFVVITGDGEILEKSKVEVKKNEFQEILRTINNGEDKAALFQDVLKEEIAGRMEEGTLESREMIDLFMSKMRFFSKMPVESLSLGKFQEFFMKFDQELIPNIYLGERLAVLNEAIISTKPNFPQKNIKIHWEKTLEKIYLEEERIGLKLKRETLETDYLIFCYTNNFYNDLVRNMKDYDPKRTKNFEEVSKDFVRMSHKITDHLTAFRDLDTISFPQILLCFRKKFWTSLREDLIVIQEPEQPFLMLFDLSKVSSRENAHILIACKLTSYESEPQVDDVLKKKIFKLLSNLFFKDTDHMSAFEANLKDIFTNSNAYFMFRNNPSNLNKAIKGVLNPCKKIFFNIPISNGKIIDKLNISITNNYNIVGQILSDCMNLDEFDQSRYENRLYDDFKIGKKKQKLNSEPQTNMLGSKTLDRKESGHENSKSSSKMDEEKPSGSMSGLNIPKESLPLHKRFSDTSSSRDPKGDQWGPYRGSQPEFSLSRSSSQPIPVQQSNLSSGPLQPQGQPLNLPQQVSPVGPPMGIQNAGPLQGQAYGYHMGFDTQQNALKPQPTAYMGHIAQPFLQESVQMTGGLLPQKGEKQQPIVINDNPVDAFNMLSGDQIAKILNNSNQGNANRFEDNFRDRRSQRSSEYEKACEYFGFSHPVVQKNNKFLHFYIQSLQEEHTERQMLDHYIDLLELKKPYRITKSFYICKLGTPFITESKDGRFSTKSIDFYDGFVSFRQYASFLNPGMLVYFYQTVIYIKEIEQMVFAIVPEDNEDLVLFHNNPEKLMSFVFKKIELITQGVNSFFKFKKQSKRYTFPSVYNALLKQKILSYYKTDSNFDTLLDKVFDTSSKKFKVETDQSLVQPNDLAMYDNPLDILQAVFFQRVKDWGLDMQIDLGEFFFGLKHPKVLTLTNLSRLNRSFSFNQLENKFQQYLCSLSKYCELKKFTLDPDNLESQDIYEYQIRRLFLDPINSAELIWYICERGSKRRSKKAAGASAVMEEEIKGSKSVVFYQMTPLASYDQSINKISVRKEAITGNSALECLENFVKRMIKQVGCKRMIVDYFEKLIAIELREYVKKHKVLKLISRMHEALPKERLHMEVEKFDTFFTKNIGTEKKGELGETVEKLKEKLRESYRFDQNLELIDNRYLLISYKK